LFLTVMMVITIIKMIFNMLMTLRVML